MSCHKRQRSTLNSWPLASIILLFNSALASSSQRARAIRIPRGLILSIPRHRGDTIDEFGFEEDVSIVEHAVFKGNHDELRVFEVRSQHLTDVLRVREIKGSIYFIQDVQRGGFEKQHGENEGKCHQRPDQGIVNKEMSGLLKSSRNSELEIEDGFRITSRSLGERETVVKIQVVA